MIRRYWTDFVYAVLALGLLAWVAWDAFVFRLITYSPGADYWEHTAVLHALLENPWHPAHPLIDSSVGSPRFGPHFVLIALFSRAFGLDALGAMSVAAVLNTAVLLAGIWAFARSYFRARRASLYALIVFFGSWFEAPHFSNVFKLKVFFSVAGYPSTAALGVSLLGLTLAVWLQRSERLRPVWLGVSSLIWAYVYITHPLTATMTLPACVLLALTEPSLERTRRLWVAGSVVSGFCLTVLWPYYPALGMVMGGTVERMAAPEDEGLHPFYAPSALFNILGFCVVSLFVLPYLWVRRQHVFLVLGALLMLGVFTLSALVPLPLGHRYVLLAVFFLQLALVKLLLVLTPRPEVGAPRRALAVRLLLEAGVGAFLLYCLVSNVDAARDHFRRTAQRDTKESVTVRYARRVGELVGPRGVVLSSALASWPLPTFGPKIVTPHHKNPLIVDAETRRRDAIRFFAPGVSSGVRREILTKYRVTHVVAAARAPSVVFDFLDRMSEGKLLPGGYTLYAVEPASARAE